MRNLAILMTTCLIVACSDGSATDTGEAAAPAVTTANGSPPGTYYVAAADGTASLVTLHSDGTYSQITPEGTYPAQGTFSVVDGLTCFRVRQVGAEPSCYAETERGPDGSYTATPPDGNPLTVTPYTVSDVSVAE